MWIRDRYNTASQPYIDQFMTENPDWADGTFSFYTDKPTSVWSGKTYTNPVNPNYVPNTKQYTENKINKDVTPNYSGKLGNSYLDNQHFAVGTTYFLDRGYIGLSADSKKSEYGVPGFSLENKSFQSTSESVPVAVSYTHLDVYKRQVTFWAAWYCFTWIILWSSLPRSDRL